MIDHPVQLFLPLAEIPPEQEIAAYDELFSRPRAAASAGKRILRKFPKLCKFLIRVSEEFGKFTLESLWCRIWAALKWERASGSHTISDAFARMADPDDRIVTLDHSRQDDEIDCCVEALEQLAFA